MLGILWTARSFTPSSVLNLITTNATLAQPDELLRVCDARLHAVPWHPRHDVWSEHWGHLRAGAAAYGVSAICVAKDEQAWSSMHACDPQDRLRLFSGES